MIRLGSPIFIVLSLALAAVTLPAGRLRADAGEVAIKAEALRKHIRTIRSTNDPHEIKTAYARGCTADRSSIALHDLYMRKMLLLGLPQIAQYGARNLMALDPANGLAWAVVSYSHGRARKMNEAFITGMKAADLIDSNPSVEHNTGMLIAWQEVSGESLKITAETEQRKQAVKKAYAAKKPYKKAYAEVAAGFMHRNRIRKEYEGRIAKIQRKHDGVLAEAQRLNRALKRLYAQWERLKKRVKSLWKRYDDLRDRHRSLPGFFKKGKSSIRELRKEITAAEKERDLVGKEYADLRAKALPKLREMKKMKKDMEDLGKESAEKTGKICPQLAWQPPAVNGVVTPFRELPPRKGAPKDPTDPGISRADNLLSLAKLYISNGMPKKASETLQKILAQHPDSKEATEAAALLKGLPK